MLRHYSHIRMEAKRTALESIVKKQSNGIAEKKEDTQLADGAKRAGYPQRVQGYRSGRGEKSKLKTECSESPTITQDFEGEYPQMSPQLAISEVHRGVRKARKSKILIGSSGRTRINNQTYFQQHAGQRMTP